MRCYLVSGGGRRRYGATQADSKIKRDDIMEETGAKRSEVSIEEVEVPMDKPSLLEFINGLCAELDAPQDKGSPEKEGPESEDDPAPEPERKAPKKKGRR